MSSTTRPNSDPALRLAELFPMVGKAFARWAHSMLECAGVSPSRMRLMGVLNCKGRQKMCDLGEELGVTARNVTTLVDGLEEEGLVRRVPHPTDRRATFVELTPQGTEMGCKMFGPFREQMAGLFRELRVADQRELLRLLEALYERLGSRDEGY